MMYVLQKFLEGADGQYKELFSGLQFYFAPSINPVREGEKERVKERESVCVFIYKRGVIAKNERMRRR